MTEQVLELYPWRVSLKQRADHALKTQEMGACVIFAYTPAHPNERYG